MEFGPDRHSDAYPLSDAAEVRAARRILGARFRILEFREVRGGPIMQFDPATGEPVAFFDTAPGADPDWLSARELELGAERDRLIWGDDPFDLEE